MVWYSHFFKNFPVCCDPHKGFGIVNKAEVDAFLELSYFFVDLTDVGNLMFQNGLWNKTDTQKNLSGIQRKMYVVHT